ncbi:hypothetical protein PR048_013112, partial [Dryococelus australis]
MYVENRKSEEKNFVSRFTVSNLLSKKNVDLFQPKKERMGNHIRRKEREKAEKQKDKDEALAANFDFLREIMSNWPQESPKVIVIWTDGCGYQNRNKVLANVLLNLATEESFTIHQKYLVKGYTPYSNG